MLSHLRISLSIIVVLFSVTSFSQSELIDSLQIELKKHPKKDTIRVNILNELGIQNYRNDSPKAIAYMEESLAISKQLKFNKGIARANYINGAIYVEQGDFNSAASYFDKAIQFYTSSNDLGGIERCNNALGVMYQYKGDFELSLKHFEKAMAISEKLGNSDKDLYLYNLGSLYSDLGEYDKARRYLNRALSINKKIHDSLGIMNCYNLIANLYYLQGSYLQALDFQNQSLDVALKIKDSIGVFQSYINMGNTYRQQNLSDKAIEFYNKALGIGKAAYNVKNVTALKNNIAGIYYDEGDYKRAIEIFKESIALSREIEDEINLAQALNGIGFAHIETKEYSKALNSFSEAKSYDLYANDLLDCHQGLADTYFARKEYDLALKYAQELADLSDRDNSLRHKKNAFSILSKIYEKTGRFKEALESHERFKVLNDSLFNEENIEKITQIEYEYKYKNQLEAAKFKEMALTETVNETTDNLEKSQRNLLYGIIIFLTVTVLLGGIIFFLRLRNVKEKTQNIITEQKLLRSQMTPHFIFNAMSVLQGIILNKEDTKAVSYLSKFSRLLRITLENSRDQLVSLKNELVAVENYIDLQNIEAKTPFVYSINIAENIDSEKVKIPPMLIQPFIENSIEHGFVNHEGDKIIEITISRKDNLLNCIITDNGVGVNTRKESVNRNKKSLSTAITTERIELLSKNTKNKGSISIEDRKKYGAQGTQVTMVIPYQAD